MAKFQSPLLGYNNNLRHRGRVFHIQTEDSGVHHPHVITHLFMDGGRILKSVKKSYAEHVGVDGMSETVRSLMKEQHRAMAIALRNGEFDAFVDGNKPTNAVATAPASTLPEAATGPATSATVKIPATNVAKPTEDATQKPSLLDIRPAESTDIALNPLAVVAVATISEEVPIASQPASPVVLEPSPPTNSTLPNDAARSDSTSSKKHPSARELTLDFDALDDEREASNVSVAYRPTDLPPPPKNLFSRESRTGTYVATGPDSRRGPAVSDDPTPMPPRTEKEPRTSASNTRTDSPASSRALSDTRAASPVSESRRGTEPLSNRGRYASTRPDAFFDSPTKSRAPESIFSEEVVAEQSLDEVILSYLAEDLDPRRRK